MQVKITAPDGKSGLVDCGENGALTFGGGDITFDDIRDSLRAVRPNSAVGEVNTPDAAAHLVLRSLESTGWLVEWPEVQEAPEEPEPTDDTEPFTDIIVN